jgi:hypothetical protein
MRDKWTKPPFQAKRICTLAKSTDRTTWATFDEAVAAYQNPASKYDGIGYAIDHETEQIVATDLDHVLGSDVELAQAQTAKEIVATLNSYTELSPSGTGLHVYAFGPLPAGGCRKGNVEMYAKGRYLTFTGRRVKGPHTIEHRAAEIAAVHAEYIARQMQSEVVGGVPSPASAMLVEQGIVVSDPAVTKLTDEQIIEKASASKHGEEFKALMAGDTSAYNGDHSAADLALCSRLAFWTQKNAEQMDRIVRRSGLMREKWDRDDYRARTIEKAISTAQDVYGSGGGSPILADKPRIITNVHEDWDNLLEQVFAELVRVNAPDPELFQRGIALVRVRVDEEGRPLIEPMTESSLKGHLARTMWWLRNTLTGLQATQPPLAVVKNLMSRKEWTGIPALRDIVQAPIFSKDGHIIATPGYHPEARLWYAPWSGMDISVPDTPTHAEVTQARELILTELLGDFPFESAGSRAHAVAAILLPFVRELIQGPTPLHLFSAPTPGSGKGLLVEVTSLIATGRPSLPVSAPRDDEEMRKRITAQLRRGTPIIVLDNVTRKLDSAALCAALTASEWQDRILGVSEMSSTLPNRALWAATGNNPELSLDVARRTITCRLDSGIERPWERKDFRHPELCGWVSAHRGELVQAVLTLVQAWLRAGSPRSQHPPIGSFESWATVMAGVLEVAGIKGFLENYKDVYEAASAEIGEWLDYVETWYEAHGGKPVLVKELCDLARQRELLSDVLGDGIDASQRTRLGNALSRHKGRVFNGYQIHQDPRSKHGTPYRLKVLAAPLAVAEPAITLEAEEAPF